MLVEARGRRGSVRRVAQRQTVLGLVTVPEKGRGKNDSEVPGLSNQRSPRKKPCVLVQRCRCLMGEWTTDQDSRFGYSSRQPATLVSLQCPCTGVFLRALPECTGETCIYADVCK